jgi:hypothetical protein
MTTKTAAEVYEVRITLMYLDPPIWRRVLVPRDVTLGNLHRVIQVAMGWEDYHLHEFQIGKKRYGGAQADPFGFDDAPINEDTVRLDEVAKPKAKFVYQYDFGDDWLHEIEVERGVEAPTGKRKARCIGGEHACPPEDCGGVPGYADLIGILNDPKHEEHGQMLEWVGADFDPMHFDQKRTDRRLSSLKV